MPRIPLLLWAVVVVASRGRNCHVHGKNIRDPDVVERRETTSTSSGGGVTFRMGELVVNVPGLGIRMSAGMSVDMIAMANRPVVGARNTNLKFHSMPDGAAIFPITTTTTTTDEDDDDDDDGGYVYVSNSEMKESLGGVYGLYFDGNDNVVDYKELLSGTTSNCGGGKTPWQTWISCEEYGMGQCWQVDPTNRRPPQITKLGGPEGGVYESVAVDDRISHQPTFYVSEDSDIGALRKYTPPILYSKLTDSPIVDWDTLTADGGTTEYLAFLDDSRFEWTTDEQAARHSQSQYYPNVEGIHYNDRRLYFVSKKLSMLFILDLDGGTYTSSSTEYGILAGGGDFGGAPDAILNEGEYLYFTEDGGKTVGVYAVHRSTGERYAIFEAYDDVYKNDETTGLAFSPDGMKMYAAFQDCGCGNSEGGLDYTCGCLLQFSRNDGYPFDGSAPSLKFHLPERWEVENV